MGNDCFNTQPPEGGCFLGYWSTGSASLVSTHSHPKVAALGFFTIHAAPAMFQHTATRRWLRWGAWACPLPISFNTQPPEGGCARKRRTNWPWKPRFNTQPPEGGCSTSKTAPAASLCFNTQPPEGGCSKQRCGVAKRASFNTQPPEGGCLLTFTNSKSPSGFNTQPPEGGCGA